MEIAENETIHGLRTIASHYRPAETLDRLEAMLRERGITVFARIEHSELAHGVGLEMRPCAVLIFGNPKAGTPLMQAAPTSAIDLPLKALTWEGPDGRSYLTVNTLEYLAGRHGIPPELTAPLRGIDALLEAAAS